MIVGPTNTRVVLTQDALPDQFLEELEQGEADHVLTVGSRDDTSTIYVVDLDNGSLFAYAVIGPNEAGSFMIYAARSTGGKMAEIALRAFFGVAQVLGKPLRVHTNKLHAFARMIGAEDYIAAMDSDGIVQGVFNG